MGKNFEKPKVHIYYGWFACVVHALQADFLVALEVDEKIVWQAFTPVARATSSNPYVFDVPQYGRVHLFWGTGTQTLTGIVATLMGSSHPPYRDRDWAFFENWKTGASRPGLPNIRFVTRRKGVQSIVTGSVIDLDTAGQANPVVALAEALTHPIVGAGQPATVAKASSWQALAELLAADKAANYLTVSEQTETTVGQVFSEVLDHIDGWQRIDENGQIELGRWAQGGGAPSGLPVITLDMLEEEPEIESVDLDEAPNLIEVVYPDRTLDWKETTARYDNQYARRRRLGVAKKERVQRPYIRRAAQASAAAPKIGRTFGQYYHEGTFTLSAALVPSILPGTLFIASLPEYGVEEVVRCIGRSGEASDEEEVELEWETERGLSLQPAILGLDELDETEVTTVEDFAYWHPVLLPPDLAGADYRIGALAGRTLGLTTRARLWMRYGGGSEGEFFELGSQANFAVPVQLADAYADTEALDDTSGNLLISQYHDPAVVGFDRLQTNQTPEAIADDNLLLIVFKAADPLQFEIMTVQEILSPTSGEYPVHVLRARFGTSRLTFAADDPAYFINRRVITTYQHSQFPSIAQQATEAGRTVEFKLQPISATEVLVLDDCTTQTLELTGQFALTPITDLNVTGAGPFTLTWTPPAGAANVELQFRSDADSYPAVGIILPASTATWDFTGGVTGETYWFRLRALSTTGGTSDWGNEPSTIWTAS